MTHAAEPVPATASYAPVPTAPAPVVSPHVSARPIGKHRGAWAVWWLSGLTFGIYYLVWYAKINGELARFAPESVTVNPTLAWLSQCLPIANLVSVAHTAGRVNAAHASVGSPVRVSGGTAVLSCFWFGSQTRYLQRRLNSLWDATQTATHHAA